MSSLSLYQAASFCLVIVARFHHARLVSIGTINILHTNLEVESSVRVWGEFDPGPSSP